MLVKIIPRSQRAKNRVREHGEIMVLKRDEGYKALFESLEETFFLGHGFDRERVMIKWTGWFENQEASFEAV